MSFRSSSVARALSTFSFAACLTFALVAHAQDTSAGAGEAQLSPTSPRLEVGVRTGVGTTVANTAAGDGMITPLIVDAGARLTPHFFVGASFAYVPYTDTSADGCGSACSTLRYRAGLEMRVDVSPRAVVDPWFGYGIYYEHARTSWSAGNDGGGGGHQSWWGYAFVGLRFGVDFHVGEHLAIGPFLSLDVGKQGHVETVKNGETFGSTPTDTYKTGQIGVGARYLF